MGHTKRCSCTLDVFPCRKILEISTWRGRGCPLRTVSLVSSEDVIMMSGRELLGTGSCHTSEYASQEAYMSKAHPSLQMEIRQCVRRVPLDSSIGIKYIPT